MLAPCMIVLSTSKNAAAVGSAGVGERGLHLGAPRPPPRRRESSAAGGSAACGSARGVTPAEPSRAGDAGAGRCGPRAVWIDRPHADRPTTSSSLVAEAAADRPRRGWPSSRPAGRSVTWAELEDEVARVATGLGAAGLVAGQRVLLALGNRIEFVDGLPRRAAGAGGRRTRSTRAPTAGELARMIADSGARVVVADADDRRRRARGGRRPGRAPLRRRADDGADAARPRVRPRVVVVGAEPSRASSRTTRCAAAAARPVPPLPDPEKLAVPALHQRYVGPAARRDAHPPGPARQHRAGRRGRAADDPRRRRGARACCRCSTSTASTPCSAACCASAPGWCWSTRFDPQAHARPDRRRGGQRACRWRRRSSPTGCPRTHLRERLGPVRLMLSGSAPLSRGAGRAVHRRAPASRSTRATG